MTSLIRNVSAWVDRYWLLLLYAGVVSVTLCVLLWENTPDYDLWGVMATGALVWESGSFPFEDVFSYTAGGQPWIYHEWGSGVVFYPVYKALGSIGLTLLDVLLMALTLGLCWRCMARSLKRDEAVAGNPGFKAFMLLAVLLLMPLSAFFFQQVIRCQVFSYLGFCLFLFLLQRAWYRQRFTRALFFLPLIMMLWVNMHGGFIMGLFALGVYALAALYEKKWALLKILLLIGVLCGGALLVNPYGLSFLTEMFSAWSMSRAAISEWGSISGESWQQVLIYLLAWGMWLFIGGRAFYKNRAAAPVLLAFALVTGLAGWLHIKLVPYFGFAMLCLGFDAAQPVWQNLPGKKTLPAMYKIFALLLVIAPWCVTGYMAFSRPSVLMVKMGEGLSPPYPVRAATYVRQQNLRGNVWIYFDWGEFFLWAFYPQIRVSMDGRYETVYPDNVFEDSHRFYMPPYDVSVLGRYPQTDYVIIPAGFTPLVEKMSAEPGWHLKYADTMTKIYGRGAENAVPEAVAGNPENTAPMDAFTGDLGRFGR